MGKHVSLTMAVRGALWTWVAVLAGSPKLLGLSAPTAVEQARQAWPSAHFWVDDLQNPSEMTSLLLGDSAHTFVIVETLEHIAQDIELTRRIVSGAQGIISVPTYDSDSHVRWFAPDSDVLARYGIRGTQWQHGRQLYAAGNFERGG